MAAKRLYKTSDNKMIGGVCNGLAEYFDVDPTIIRLIWVIFAFCAGGGVLAYLIAWSIMKALVPNYKPIEA